MPPLTPVQSLLARAARTESGAAENAAAALARVNSNAGRNSYLAVDPDWTLDQACLQTPRRFRIAKKPPLFGLPVSLKDCFNLEGFRTSGGVKFYEQHKEVEYSDSAIATRLKRAGAVIVGKTHMQQIEYGITGENPDYGDCLQPGRPDRLTGGSSSGAAASILEGSAAFAVGTDTGGSIRVPAALCGLAGYRASLGLGDWRGGMHLAPSFDTIGCLFRDLRDALLLGGILVDLPSAPERPREHEPRQIGYLDNSMIDQCDPASAAGYRWWLDRLRQSGAVLTAVHPDCWQEALDVFVPLQASEAAHIYKGDFQHFDPSIAARLEDGEAMSPNEVAQWRREVDRVRRRVRSMMSEFDFFIAPVTPVSVLAAGADQSPNRSRILRHTCPISVAGLPAVVLPSPDCGVQLIASHNRDHNLLRFAVELGEQLAREN
jgi:Asp-tRNA(Asn)/Glu-tRNA(Gln) amidotransferase A subunit family amidase